jgi:hypothetical protein
MLCPVCHTPTISFLEWCRARNAFRWMCPHCRTSLRANRTTWLTFFLSLAVVVIGPIALERRGYIPQGHGRGTLLLALPLILPLAYLGYKCGGYIV